MVMETGKAPQSTSINNKPSSGRSIPLRPKQHERFTLSPGVKGHEGGDKTVYINTSQSHDKTRDITRSSPEVRKDETSQEDDKASSTHTKRHEEERGMDVASKASSRYLNKFIDYYNEALRKRLIRQLEESVKNARIIELDFDSPSDSEDDGPPTHSIWGEPLKPDPKKEEEKKGKWKGVVRSGGGFAPLRRKSTAAEQQRLERRMAVLRRFRKKAKIIIFCIRCIKEHCFK